MKDSFIHLALTLDIVLSIKDSSNVAIFNISFQIIP